MHAHLIINPASHRIRPGASGERLREMLAERGVAAEVKYTRGPSHAADLARDAAASGASLVVVAGGDGTICEAVTGLEGTGVPLGVVPAGTGNVLRRQYDLPFDWGKACDVIAAGRTQHVDVGHVGERAFLLHASAGHSALVVQHVKQRLKDVLGQFAFVLSIARRIADGQQWEMQVETDAGEWCGRAWDCVVSNSRYLAWRLKLAPHGRMDSGVFEVSVFHACSRLAFVGSYLRALRGVHDHSPLVTTYQARRVSATAEPEAPVQTDGDVLGQTPLACEIRPRALRLIVP